MTTPSDAYLAAEADMGVPPVSARGRSDQNPKDIGFWALVAEDFATHERKLFEQGFWAIFVHRFGNWRMGQPKLIRAPSTLLYRIMFKLVEWICGISLWYTVKLGRRVRIWHHSGMSLGARAIGDDCHIRQNTTLGVAQTGRNNELPIIGPGADIGAGAVVAGAVYVGANTKIGANALVIADVPDGATAIGNPAQVYGGTPVAAPVLTPAPPASTPETHLETPRDMGVIALLGSSNLDTLAEDIKDSARQYSLEIDTYVPPFGQARMALLQESSPLVEALGDGFAATLIVERAEDLLGEVYTAPLSLDKEDASSYLDAALEPLLDLVRDARKRLPGPVFVMRLAVMTRSSLGLADATAEAGLTTLIEAANRKLHEACAALSDVHLLDADALISETGRDAAQPGQFWHLGRMPFSTVFNRRLARRVLGGLLSLRGQSARIIVLDLDNTLWGGVLGEDGMEGLAIGHSAYPGSAYSAFQEALRALTQRGIALAVASKNDEDLALQMIDTHPEMTLRLSDIVSHRIGWVEKSHGIAEMLDEIGLGAANAMFIDDNPVEREKARKNVPGLIVPPFPDAPEDLARWLLDSPFLEAMSLTGSDLKRTAQYKVRAREVSAKREFANIEEFYRDLDMRLTFEPYSPANQQRVLQLFVKTNQFNATLRRHDAGAVQQILDEGGEVFAIGVADRHSSYELMGVIALRPDAAMKTAYPEDEAVQSLKAEGAWWVDSVLLSCRILGRTVEQAIVAWATAHAQEAGATALIGQVIEAPRNTPVRDLFSKSGLDPVATDFDLGAGGLYRHDLSKGALDVPDYFTLSDTAPAPVATTAKAASKPRPPKPVSTAASPAIAIPVADLEHGKQAALADTFRRVFRLGADDDVQDTTMDSLAAWDSLGHLRLAMELEQSLGLRLPAARLGQISSYAELQKAVAEAMQGAA
ncbi:HAD superfamily phosphatase (TIGR01681 family)/FkbH-like protein [Litoreibacter meonggei]|uniref:HAD superfamily phosphatase (TIGR01681 family)/FkbH-like protein n=1 Tax=Litoreibacter meonggei TaxID=1049199 RepID=A0A497V1Z0_9RHOB|nr:HAD-IIIC family phosphatase [Litoreibacter meonggei]RLJ36217.1 HAD superfamily phosphatase (TIGR01681 family)/FkbH-like protein [Litoreibacter meonggei]